MIKSFIQNKIIVYKKYVSIRSDIFAYIHILYINYIFELTEYL